MMKFHPVLNQDYQKIRWMLNAIAYKIGGKLSRNPTFDERGLTDELLDLLLTSFNHIKLSKYYINIHVNKPSEKKTGADILVRTIVKRQEISFDRYVLLQAKKYLLRSEQFNETNVGNTHLTGQIAKLHTYNPEFSYLLLYSTHSEPSANFVIGQSNLHSSLFENFFLDFDDLIQFGHLSPSVNIQSSYPVTLLRTKTWEKFTDTKYHNLLNYSEVFPNFILDDLIAGKIGKEWDSTIEKAQGVFSIVLTITVGQG